MRYSIVSEIPGRARLRLAAGYLSEGEANGIEASLRAVVGVRSVSVHAANASLLLCWDASVASARAEALAEIGSLDLLNLPVATMPSDEPDVALVKEDERFQLEVGHLVAWSMLRRFLLPLPVRSAVTVLRALRLDAGNACCLQALLQVVANLNIFMQVICKILISIPFGIPGLDDTQANTMRINFLTQNRFPPS